MRYARFLAAASATVLSATASLAADIIPPPPPVEETFGNWYLRGDIGFANQQLSGLNNALYAGNTIQAVGMGFDGAPFFGIGIGYQWNSWLRTDITGEYRSRANFHGLDIVTPVGPGPTFTDEYSASKSEWLFLANAYLDLGTWWNITPFIGAGVGASRNTIHSFRDVCTTCPGGGVAFGDTASTWNFAWAVHAGLAYRVTNSFTVELAYRYVDLGDAQSGDLVTYLGGNLTNNPMHFEDLTSHDVKLGIRWAFDAAPAYSEPPSIYAPPPPVSPRG